MKITFIGNVIITVFFLFLSCVMIIRYLDLKASIIPLAIGAFIIGVWQVFTALINTVTLGKTDQYKMHLVAYWLLVISFFSISGFFSNEISAMSEYKMYTFEIGIPFIIYLFHFYYSYKFKDNA